MIRAVGVAPLDLPTDDQITHAVADIVLAVNDEHYSVLYLGTGTVCVCVCVHMCACVCMCVSVVLRMQIEHLVPGGDQVWWSAANLRTERCQSDLNNTCIPLCLAMRESASCTLAC